jgi:hypothetical protein
MILDQKRILIRDTNDYLLDDQTMIASALLMSEILLFPLLCQKADRMMKPQKSTNC